MSSDAEFAAVLSLTLISTAVIRYFALKFSLSRGYSEQRRRYVVVVPIFAAMFVIFDSFLLLRPWKWWTPALLAVLLAFQLIVIVACIACLNFAISLARAASKPMR